MPILNTIEGTFAIGALIGLVIGFVVRNRPIGCSVMMVVPIIMIGYIAYWQSQHPENLRSTSALDFVFGPLWPSLGAITGYVVGQVLWSFLRRSPD